VKYLCEVVLCSTLLRQILGCLSDPYSTSHVQRGSIKSAMSDDKRYNNNHRYQPCSSSDFEQGDFRQPAKVTLYWLLRWWWLFLYACFASELISSLRWRHLVNVPNRLPNSVWLKTSQDYFSNNVSWIWLACVCWIVLLCELIYSLSLCNLAWKRNPKHLCNGILFALHNWRKSAIKLSKTARDNLNIVKVYLKNI